MSHERVTLQAMSHYSAKAFRISLALILSLWIAGAGCMLGCQNMVASAAVGEPAEGQPAAHLALVVSGEACASNQSHDCCAKKRAEAKVKASESTSRSTARPSLQTAALVSQRDSLNPAPSGGMRECPLALSRAVAVTKTSAGKQLAAPVALPLDALPSETSFDQHSFLSPLARLPNRGHTYLRCCVFLI